MAESSEKQPETSTSSDPRDRRLFAYLSLLGLFCILWRTSLTELSPNNANLMGSLAYCFAGIVGAYVGFKFAVEGFGKR